MQVDPFSEVFRRDPYAAYTKLRNADPVHRSAVGAWIVTRYDDARATLGDERLAHWTGAGDDPATFNSIMSRWVRLMDPRNSTQLRKRVASMLSVEALCGLECRIREMVRDRLREATALGHIDIVKRIARPVTLSVAAGLLGVPADEEYLFEQHVANLLIGAFDFGGGAASNSDPGGRACSFASFVMELARRKRASPGDDLISALTQAHSDGDDVSEADYVAFATIFLFAAQENIANFIGNAMLSLMTHPPQWELLRHEPSLFPNAVEELLRFDSPVQFVNLLPLRDLEIGGKPIKEGEPVLISIGSANRDPARFANPDCLDVTRAPLGHLTFGAGALYCVGASLARLQGRVVLEELVRPFPPMITASNDLQWRSSPAVLRGLTSLQARFAAGFEATGDQSISA